MTLDEAVQRASRLSPLERRLRDALIDARRQLEDYEFARTGEQYNNTHINNVLEEAARVESDRAAIQMVPVVGTVNEGEK